MTEQTPETAVNVELPAKEQTTVDVAADQAVVNTAPDGGGNDGDVQVGETETGSADTGGDETGGGETE